MTDTLRARIAAAILKEGQLRVCKLSDADIRYITDAILAIPGIAVVELPEPAEAVRCWPALVGGEPESVYLAQGEVIVSGGLRVYVDEARNLAAALLAAADLAERDQ